MDQRERLFAADDLVQVAPLGVLKYLVAGILQRHSLRIAIMLDKDDTDPHNSAGTGKLFIAERGEEYCHVIRDLTDGKANNRCAIAHRQFFEEAKRRLRANPHHSGEIGLCCPAGGLAGFYVPIVERESNTFVGIVLAGQKRLLEPDREAKKRLENFVAQPGNQLLRKVPFRNLWSDYSKLSTATEVQLREMKSKCETVAAEIAELFTHFARLKKVELEKRLEDETSRRIYGALIDAANVAAYWESMDRALESLQQWLCFDWGLILEAPNAKSAARSFVVRSVVGRGIGPKEPLVGKRWSASDDESISKKGLQKNPDFLLPNVRSLVSGAAEYWWVPLNDNGKALFGGLVFGSAPEHRNSEYDPFHIQQQLSRLEDIVGKMQTVYNILAATDRERLHIAQLEESGRRLTQTVGQMEDLTLGLTHTLKRPSFLAQATLSLVRDYFGKARPDVLHQQLELSAAIVKDYELLCRGISKIFAADSAQRDERFSGARCDFKRDIIDVKTELRKLCEAMKFSSGRRDIDFTYFDASPEITMDRDSFLYVFYVLIDNAIKYHDLGSYVELGCSKERAADHYAIKVKSKGIPILPEWRELVFQKFWRSREAARVDETGTGIGCWSAREHMRRQGGDLKLEVDGRLSVFIVYPPAKTR